MRIENISSFVLSGFYYRLYINDTTVWCNVSKEKHTFFLRNSKEGEHVTLVSVGTVVDFSKNPEQFLKDIRLKVEKEIKAVSIKDEDIEYAKKNWQRLWFVDQIKRKMN